MPKSGVRIFIANANAKANPLKTNAKANAIKDK
jgi:hypothetical protein